MNLDTRGSRPPGAAGDLERASAELKKEDAAKEAAAAAMEQAYEDADTLPDKTESAPTAVTVETVPGTEPLQEVEGWADAPTVLEAPVSQERFRAQGPEVDQDADTMPNVTEAPARELGEGSIDEEMDTVESTSAELPENSLNEDMDSVESGESTEKNYETIGREMREKAMKEAEEVMNQVAGELGHAIETAGPALVSLMDRIAGQLQEKSGEVIVWRDQAQKDIEASLQFVNEELPALQDAYIDETIDRAVLPFLKAGKEVSDAYDEVTMSVNKGVKDVKRTFDSMDADATLLVRDAKVAIAGAKLDLLDAGRGAAMSFAEKLADMFKDIASKDSKETARLDQLSKLARMRNA